MIPRFLQSKASLIPIVVVFFFLGAALYSFSLLRSNEADLRKFDISILEQKQTIIEFQLAVQDAITDLYKLTSTAATEADKIKLKNLATEDLVFLNQLNTKYPIARAAMVNAGVAADKIASIDYLMPSYLSSSKNVIDMVDTDAATAMAWMTPTASKFTQIDTLLDGINHDLAIGKEQRLTQLTSEMEKGRYIFIIIILAVSAIAFFMSFVLRRFLATLETLNASMNAMLDGLGQGLLFFDRNGICAPVYSKACLTLLEGNPAKKHITEVLKLTPENRILFQTTLSMLYAGKLTLGFDEWAALAPASYAHNGGLSISLSYRPIMGTDGNINSILLVAVDRTKEKQIEKIVEENEAAVVRTLRISRNRNHFIRFVQNFNDCILAPSSAMSAVSAEQIRRDVHTLKGTADMFQLTVLADKLHRLEADIPENADQPNAIVAEHRTALKTSFDNDVALAREILSDDFQSSGEVRTVPEKNLYAFANHLQSALTSGHLPQQLYDDYIRELIAVPIWNLMRDFAMSLQELSDRFGKPLHACVFLGENFPILPKIYEPLFVTFVHIARNIIDHGIESSALRKERGKDANARVTVQTHTFQHDAHDWFAIEFIDDGGGINVPLLRKRLIKKLNLQNLDQADDEEVIQHIFDAGISTKERTTMVSGRGVGLNAVKAEVVKLGGTIAVYSKFQLGVTIKITLPFIRSLQ